MGWRAMSEPLEDLDRIASELEAIRPDVPVGASRLDGWLHLVAEREASDLLLLAGEPPTLRVNGLVVRSEGAPLDGQDIEDMVLPELPVHAQRMYREQGIADASRRVQGIGRFRINLHHERGRAAAVIRM